MRAIIDLHLHSRYSRACSPNLTFPNLTAWASAKGIDVLATSDFTHPAWLAAIEEQLEPAEEGLFRLRAGLEEGGSGSYAAAPKAAGRREVRFLLGTELSCIYKKGDRTRRLHVLVLLPTIAAAKRLVAELERRECNLRSDGRPILGLDAAEILRICLDIDERAMVIPAHAWTPWYSVFGSMSGFDSLEECFGDLTRHIHAIETGLSSDPLMNRRLSKLDGVMLISNSDAHGLRNLAREANVFDLPELSYGALTDVLRKRQTDRFLYTIEFYPEEGKYHADGHRACAFSCDPAETERLKGICPVCKKPLTRGVQGRVHALADRPLGSPLPNRAVPYRSIIPLEEVIADTLGKGKAAKAVGEAYARVLERVGTEFHVLLDAAPADIAAAGGERIAEAVQRVREGRCSITPGYDGEYGIVKVFGGKDRPAQRGLDI
jgi:DNA helicase II / ATP-dependent DNA helicase PcrA